MQGVQFQLIFVKVTDDRISNFKENAVSETAKEKNCFRGKKLRCRTALNRRKMIETFVKYVCKNVFCTTDCFFK